MIKKEINLKAPLRDVWRFITSPEHFKTLWDSNVELVLKKGGAIRILQKGETVRIINLEAPTLFSISGGYGSAPITTTYLLSETKKGTNLKISVGGWEAMSQAEIRRQVPVISLEWEKRLAGIKKAVETSLVAGKNRSSKTAISKRTGAKA